MTIAKTGGMEVPEPQDSREARAWLQEMAGAAMASGGMSSAETALLQRVGARYGLGKFDMEQIIAGSRREAYQRAKKNLKGEKS